MKDLLKEAFTRASRGLDLLCDTFDRAGFYIWRAMTDETFLSMGHVPFKSNTLRDAADTCDWAKGRVQNYIYKDILNKGITGNVGPKPNYKPLLSKAFGAAAPHIARLHVANPAVMALSIAVIAAGMYMFAHDGSSYAAPEMMAMWHGAHGGQSSAPSPP